MKLSHLSKEAWDSAQEAARILTTVSIDREEDRNAFRQAKANLAALLPIGTDGATVGQLIGEAVRWRMIDSIAEICAGMPMEMLCD